MNATSDGSKKRTNEGKMTRNIRKTTRAFIDDFIEKQKQIKEREEKKQDAIQRKDNRQIDHLVQRQKAVISITTRK
jgi:hypothetical protein